MSRIKVRNYRIAMPSWNKPVQPIRIAVIGDLHNRVFGEANNQLVETIMSQFPDLILSVGDLTVSHAGKEMNLDVGLALLKRLSCECPVYCINGNHEFRTKADPKTYEGIYEKLTANLQRMGIGLLEDACAQMEVKGAKLAIHGYELPMKYYKKFAKEYVKPEEIRRQIGENVEGHYNILLAHNPMYFESYALWGADLTLSGHFHGGSVRLPFVGGLISPQLKLFPKYDRGMFQKYGRKLIVTAGLGTHSIAFRVNNPPEVVMVELF